MVKKITSYIISFLLIILIIMSIILGITENTVLNREYVEDMLEKIGYYEKLEKTIMDGFENYIMQSGMDTSVFEGVYDSEQIKKDMSNILDVIYNNDELDIDTETMKEKLDENIKEYAEDNNILITSSVKSQIQTFEETIIDTYYSSVVYSASALNSIGKVVYKIIPMVTIAKYVVYAVTVVFILILMIINRKNITQTLKYLGVSLISSGGLLILVEILEKMYINTSGVTIFNDNISMILETIVSDILNKFTIIGIIAIIVGIIFNIISALTAKEE